MMLTAEALKSNNIGKLAMVQFFQECGISMNFPHLQRRLLDQNWSYRQAAVLKEAGLWEEPPKPDIEVQVNKLFSIMRNNNKTANPNNPGELIKVKIQVQESE